MEQAHKTLLQEIIIARSFSSIAIDFKKIIVLDHDLGFLSLLVMTPT
jgi:hypothetical protein